MIGTASDLSIDVNTPSLLLLNETMVHINYISGSDPLLSHTPLCQLAKLRVQVVPYK
jgi:hypothetical protein